MKMGRAFTSVLCAIGAFSAINAKAAPPSVFTYQGQLKYRGVPASGEARFSFSLWDAETDGRQVGPTVDARLVIVNGLFTAALDFGIEAFNGEPRWLDISVSTVHGEGVLAPRQPITPAPFALFAMTGNPGPRGLAGSAGTDGTDGLACWDLNGDGIQDRSEDTNGDGVFDTLDCQGAGGSTEFTLPYAGTDISDETAFAITNIGLGGTAAFLSANTNNTDATVGVSTYGTGPGVMSVAVGGGSAIVGATGTAGGHAGLFSVVGLTATQSALEVTNAALGPAAHFETLNTGSTADTTLTTNNGIGTAIHGQNSDAGRAALLEVNFTGVRTLPALEVVSAARGGGAGLFKTTNVTNTSIALAAEAAGNAIAIQGTSKGSGVAVNAYNAFGGNAVVGTVDGSTGRAGLFRSTDANNPNPSLEAVRSGPGSAGRFENQSASGLAGEFVGNVSVAGTATAASFQHIAPRTHHLSLGAMDFVPSSPLKNCSSVPCGRRYPAFGATHEGWRYTKNGVDAFFNRLLVPGA